MCCALKSTSEGKGERRRGLRCEKEYNKLFVCGYESELFVCDQRRMHSANSVEKRVLNGRKLNYSGINIPEFIQ